MNLQVYEGYLGSGKTLGMSINAKYWQEMSGCTLYSNYGLSGSKPFTSMHDFLDVAKQPSSIICLDEAHVDLDARSFSTNHVKFFTQVSFYLRKLRCSLFITSPLFDNLDTRIRGITNIFVHVSKDKNYFYYPMYDIQSLKYLGTKKIRKENAFAIASQLYDTNALVTPITIPNTKEEYNKFLDELKQCTLDYQEQAVGVARRTTTDARIEVGI